MKWILIEGPDRAGKTTQSSLLVSRLQANNQPAISVRDPGGTKLSEELRRVIKDPTVDRSVGTDVLLFMASRCETFRQIIQPNLGQQWIVQDRWLLSSLVYQVWSQDTPPCTGDLMVDIYKGFIDRVPDVCFVLKSNPTTLKDRRSSPTDRFESMSDSYHERVAYNYNELTDFIPVIAKELVMIPAGTVEETHEAIWNHLFQKESNNE